MAREEEKFSLRGAPDTRPRRAEFSCRLEPIVFRPSLPIPSDAAVNGGAGLGRRALLGALLAGPAALCLPSLAFTAPRSLFDGVTLGQWKSVNFGGEGTVSVVDGAIRLERGNDLTGIVWTGPVPRAPFRIAMESRRVDGSDFFCTVTVPVAGSHCSFVVGGWGGGVVGFSSLDGLDASENETSKGLRLDDGRWYRVAVDVTNERIAGLIDGEVVAEAALKGREVDVRVEMLPCRPLGVASWRTTSDIRAITLEEQA